jgi:hypothetical protein
VFGTGAKIPVVDHVLKADVAAAFSGRRVGSASRIFVRKWVGIFENHETGRRDSAGDAMTRCYDNGG